MFNKLFNLRSKTKILKSECLRQQIIYSTEQHIYIKNSYAWCQRFCKEFCMKQAIDDCIDSNKGFCEQNCSEECFYTGIKIK